MRSINLQMDGNQICATWDNFDCLATSPAGFGDTIWQAFGRLIDNTPAIEINAIVTSIENAPQNTKELAATDSIKVAMPSFEELWSCIEANYRSLGLNRENCNYLVAVKDGARELYKLVTATI